MDDVEVIAASLVREYLSRKGLKNTLHTLDEEFPRSPMGINNRMDLMKALHIQSQMKRNKESDKPYKTMVEVMIKHFTDKATSKQGKRTPEDDDESTRPLSSLSASSSKKKHGDLIIDDDIEGEMLMGEGKAGIFGKVEGVDMYKVGVIKPQRHEPASKMRGMSGPVSSNIDHKGKDRQWKFGRPLAVDNEENSTKTNAKNADFASQDILSSKSADASRKEKEISSLLSDNPIKPVQKPQTTSVTATQASNTTAKKKTVEEILNAKTDKTSYDKFLKLRREERKKQELENNNKMGIEQTLQSTVNNNVGYDVNRSSIARENNPIRQHSGGSDSLKRLNSEELVKENGKSSGKVPDGDIEVGEVEEETGFADVPPVKLKSPPKPNKKVETKPIDLQTAIELKQVLFGSVTKDFSAEWKYQGFTFCDIKKLQYGIVQKKGGPCGVLASVQALVLQELLFTRNTKAPPSYSDTQLINSLQPSPVKRTDCLSKALAKILWRAGGYKKAIVTVPTGRPQFHLTNKFKGDNLTETLLLYIFETYDDLLYFLQQNNPQFELHGNNGVIHSLFSIVLSRTISGVKEDMDEPTNKLIGAHFYCSQDLVNLYLTGFAVSNVFNDTLELDSGGTTTTVLKGLKGRNDIGFLSLFEHYKSCQVGTYYKTPVYPIWVICSESHFSVLFALNKDLMNNWRAERRFDLYYYDGLGNQDEEIRLTIDTTNQYYQPPKDDDLVPPIDLCIRTKWEDAEIDWNGTEPLL